VAKHSHISLAMARPDIPSEVLGEIFFFAIRGPISNVDDDGSLFPWHLGRVCKEWRHAFVTHPKLWASITLDVQCDVKRDVLQMLYHRFLLCLQRSGDHPLNITLHFSSDTWDEDGRSRSLWALIWKAFLSCSHRWKSIILHGSDPSAFDDLVLCKEKLPLLQRLSIQTFRPGFDWDVYGQAPCLTQVDLHLIYEVVSPRWSFPWSQLTTFSLGMNEISSNSLQVLLENLQGIQELRIFYSSGHSRAYSFPPTCLKHLRVLDVDCPILPVMTAPSLLELRLEMMSESWLASYGDPELYDFKAVETFIKLSGCRLRKLIIAGFRAAYVKPLADLFHYIEELCIESTYGTCNLLEVLADKQEFVAFPKLRIFTLISTPEYVDQNIETIRTILELRNGPYVGAPPSNSLMPLDKIVLQLKAERSGRSQSYDRAPIPPAFKDAIPMWAPFEIDIQVEQ
jgi:hypothetical protein